MERLKSNIIFSLLVVSLCDRGSRGWTETIKGWNAKLILPSTYNVKVPINQRMYKGEMKHRESLSDMDRKERSDFENGEENRKYILFA